MRGEEVNTPLSGYGCLRCGKFIGYEMVGMPLCCNFGCQHDFEIDGELDLQTRELNFYTSRNEGHERLKKRARELNETKKES